jgi:hypothetical protein
MYTKRFIHSILIVQKKIHTNTCDITFFKNKKAFEFDIDIFCFVATSNMSIPQNCYLLRENI